MEKSGPKLFLSKDLQIPLEAVTQTFGILATKGAGKTNTGVVMVEEMMERGQRVVVADPTGVWFGLRSTADGTKEGFPVVIFGGEKGDLPLDEADGDMVAEAIVDGQFSSILDLSHFSKGKQTKFMTAFAETFYLKQAKHRRPIHFMIDEADLFAPQQAMPGEKRMLGALDDIVRRGRSRGMGCTMITQRSAVLNKNVLSMIEVLIAMRVTAPQDADVIEYWLKRNVNKEQMLNVMQSMASLQNGEAWVWSPSWLKIFQRTQIRMRGTFDSAATPKMTKQIKAVLTRAEINLDALGEQIAKAREKAQTVDPKFLQQQVRKLQQQLAAANNAKPDSAPVKELQNKLRIADHDTRHKLRTADYEMQRLAKEYASNLGKQQKHIEALEQVNKELEGHKLHFLDNLQGFFDGLYQASRESTEATTKLENLSRQLTHYCMMARKQKVKAAPIAPTIKPLKDPVKLDLVDSTPMPPAAEAPPRPPVKQAVPNDYPQDPDSVPPTGKGEIRIMQVLAAVHPETLSRLELHIQAGFSPSGTFTTYLSNLRTAGFLSEDGSGKLGISQSGLDFLGTNRPSSKSSIEIQELWCQKVGGARKLLKTLIEVYPSGLQRSVLAEQSGMSLSGTFTTYLSTLRSNNLIEDSERGGEITASPALFL